MVERVFAGAGLILLPFIFEVGVADEMRLPKAKALFLMAMLYGAAKIWQKIDKPLAALCAVVSLSGFFSSTGVAYNDLLFFWAAILSATWMKTMQEKDLLGGLRIFECVGVVIAVYGIVQITGNDPWIEYYAWAENWRPTALFGQHTLYGPFAVAGFLIALFRRHYVVAAILLFPIVVINSSFTFLSLFAGLAVWVWFTYRKAVPHISVCTVILCVLAATFYPNKVAEGLNDKGRFELWGQTLYLISKKPLFGYGFGSFKEIYPVFQVPELRKANGITDEGMSASTLAFIKKAEHVRAESGVFMTVHNDLLNLCFESGLAAVLCILAMAVQFWRSLRSRLWIPLYPLLLAVLLAVCANSLGSFPFRLIPQALIPLWIYAFIVTRLPAKLK